MTNTALIVVTDAKRSLHVAHSSFNRLFVSTRFVRSREVSFSRTILPESTTLNPRSKTPRTLSSRKSFLFACNNCSQSGAGPCFFYVKPETRPRSKFKS